jgi:lysophospholipase L1-like esterase
MCKCSKTLSEEKKMKRNIICKVFAAFAMTFVCTVIAFSQDQWRYTAMGDSLATGYTSPSGGYVPRYKTHIQTDTSAVVNLSNYGVNGRTSGSLLTALRMDSSLQTSLAQSNVVTWNIGINDLMNARNSYKNKKCGGVDNQDCLRNMVNTFKTNWSAIIGEILARRSFSDTIIRTMDIYNPWVKVDKAKNTFSDTKEPIQSRGNDFLVLKYYLDQMNNHIAATSNNNSIPSAQVYLAFNGTNGDEDPIVKGYIHTDGLHPSNTGFQLLANLFRNVGYAPLR